MAGLLVVGEGAPAVILSVIRHASLRRTGRYQPDGTLDLSWKDRTRRDVVDGDEATANP